jgi:hypothetical protein
LLAHDHDRFSKINYNKINKVKAQTVLLPNYGVLPTASIFTETFEEIFPAEWHFFTKLGPQVSPFPVPISGVNNRPLNVFARDFVKPSVDLGLSPSSQVDTSGGCLESNGRGAHG